MRNTRMLGLVAIGALLSGSIGVDSEPRLAQAAPPPVSPTAVPVSPMVAPTNAAKKTADGTIGHLEHPERLANVFARLRDVEEHKAQSDVRMIQFGDSHTASDYGTSVVRARLTAKFGDGGRGFLPLGEPYKRLFQVGESMTRGSGFDPTEALRTSRLGGSGLFGPTGIAMDTNAPGASMTSMWSASADRLEVAYLDQPHGGSFDVLLDGKKIGRVSTGGATRASAFHTFNVARGPHTFEVRAVGDGPLRLFGVRLDDDAVGVTFDSFGINGAKATTLLATDENHLAEQIARVAPSLAVVAYGTNESGDPGMNLDEHVAAIRTLISRVRKAAPTAECVVLGPPDRASKTASGTRTLTKLVEIVGAQRRAADEAGCAFFDQFHAMGAENSIARWASENPPRARRDLVHLTRPGYAFLADAFVNDMLGAYERWKTEKSNVASLSRSH